MKGKLTMDNMLGVKDVKGVLVDLLAKLTSDDWQSWLTEVKKFLRKEPCWERDVAVIPIERSFPVWGTIRLGTGLKTADDFRAAIKSAGRYIGGMGDNILVDPAFFVSPVEREVDLVVASNADLGFKDGAKMKDTNARIVELGYDLLPNEAGPQIVLQCGDQLKIGGNWLLVAMEPIMDPCCHKFFSVERDMFGKLCLYGHITNPDNVLNANALFVFGRRRK